VIRLARLSGPPLSVVALGRRSASPVRSGGGLGNWEDSFVEDIVSQGSGGRGIVACSGDDSGVVSADSSYYRTEAERRVRS